MHLELGSSVTCIDGEAGRLVALIANPGTLSLAHIAVEPGHRPGRARLVPIDLVRDAEAAHVRLGCRLEEFRGLPDFRDVVFVPQGVEYGDPGSGLSWPPGGLGVRDAPVLTDRVPAGEVEIRRHEHVRASDGGSGRVEGLVIDAGGHITEVLLRGGRMWRRRDVAIPGEFVADIDERGIHVLLSRRAIAHLPEIDHPSAVNGGGR